MRKIISWLCLSSIGMACLLFNALPAHAQNARSWVSGIGSDANNCTLGAPCATFGRAISVTNAGGIISCLTPGEFGSVFIGISITIDCTGIFAGLSVTSGDGIHIDASASDLVRLRGLSIEGVGGVNGVKVVQAGAVHIEQCRIFGFADNGIQFLIPSNVGSELYVSNSVISENGTNTSNTGILVDAFGTATARVSLSKVNLHNNFYGLFVRSNAGSTGRVSLSLRDSTAAGNNGNGIHVVAQGAPVVTAVDNVTTTENATGLVADGAATRVLISRLTAIANFIGMDTPNSGVVVSYGDNHINNNISVNGTPTVVQTSQ
jgi:hypothetical protein